MIPIADIHSPLTWTGERWEERGEGVANGHLIKAAKDLLAACKDFDIAMRSKDRPDMLLLVKALHKANAAIARATGDSQ